MRIIRFQKDGKTVVAAVDDRQEIYPLPLSGVQELFHLAGLIGLTPLELVQKMIREQTPLAVPFQKLSLLLPFEVQEVWACGVTFSKSRDGRNEETNRSENPRGRTFYDEVYDAKRPEIFFKATKERLAGPCEDLFLRTDSSWQVPEPEVGLVLNRKGEVIGYTVGNDLSCRDIEGENPLYLPQAKIWHRSCSIGPALRLAETVRNPYQLEIICRIFRKENEVFVGKASTEQLKRTYDELVSCLLQDNTILDGTVLLTGTSIVPPASFTLQDGDVIEIYVPSIGTLVNRVKKRPLPGGKTADGGQRFGYVT